MATLEQKRKQIIAEIGTVKFWACYEKGKAVTLLMHADKEGYIEKVSPRLNIRYIKNLRRLYANQGK